MRNFVLLAIAIAGLAPVAAFGETLFQSPEWAVYQNDPQDTQFKNSCEMVGVYFNIVISAKDRVATFQLPVLDGQGNVPDGPFPISITFDDGSPQLLQAKHVAEYETTMATIPQFMNFLELFARSRSVQITGGGVDRKVDLKGSRTVADAFMKCIMR